MTVADPLRLCTGAILQSAASGPRQEWARPVERYDCSPNDTVHQFCLDCWLQMHQRFRGDLRYLSLLNLNRWRLQVDVEMLYQMLRETVGA